MSRDDRSNLKTAYHAIDTKTERTYMTVAEQLIRQGKREGERRGGRRMLRIVLEARFGRLSAAARAKLAAATEEELDRWVRAAITAKSLGEALA